MNLPIVNTMKEKLGKIGLTHERKALALFILSLFNAYFLLLMLITRDAQPEWFPAMTAMFAMYAITFMGVAADWFWGRWVAIGVGTWGTTIAIWGMASARSIEPALVVLGVTHGLIALFLMGNSMAAHYEGRPDWRVRFGLDDEGVMKLRRSVTRAASSVPALVLFALAPRQEEGAALVVCAVVGLGLLLAGRTLSLGVLALAATGAMGLVAFGPHVAMNGNGLFLLRSENMGLGLGTFAAVALVASIAPFLAPIGRYLRGSSAQ